MAQPGSRKPQKKYSQGLSNPLSDHCSTTQSPDRWDYASLYTERALGQGGVVTFADIGCGYGGLLVNLSKLFPGKSGPRHGDQSQSSDYVVDRDQSSARVNPASTAISPASKGNAMKYLPCFAKGQLEKMFFLTRSAL